MAVQSLSPYTASPSEFGHRVKVQVLPGRERMQKYLEVACTKLSRMTSLLLLITNRYGEGFSEHYAYRRNLKSSHSYFTLTGREKEIDPHVRVVCIYYASCSLYDITMCIYPSMPVVRKDTVDPCSSQLSRIVWKIDGTIFTLTAGRSLMVWMSLILLLLIDIVKMHRDGARRRGLWPLSLRKEYSILVLLCYAHLLIYCIVKSTLREVHR